MQICAAGIWWLVGWRLLTILRAVLGAYHLRLSLDQLIDRLYGNLGLFWLMKIVIYR